MLRHLASSTTPIPHDPRDGHKAAGARYPGTMSGGASVVCVARKPTSRGGGTEQTRLRWPRVRAEGELRRQIDEGERLRESLSGPSGVQNYDEYRGTCQRWHERNRTILDQAFSRSLATEYEPIRAARISSVYDRPPTL